MAGAARLLPGIRHRPETAGSRPGPGVTAHGPRWERQSCGGKLVSASMTACTAFIACSGRTRDGEWKYLAVEDNEYLFNLAQDERERANLAHRQPERLEAMRRQYAAWSDRMRAAHPEARSELVYTERDMPRR